MLLDVLVLLNVLALLAGAGELPPLQAVNSGDKATASENVGNQLKRVDMAAPKR